MNGARQTWLVAVREMRERSRSGAFRASLVVMLLVVVGVIILPALIGSRVGAKDVGLAGSIPTELPGAIRNQAAAVGLTARTHRYDTLAAAEKAVRAGAVDVLVVDAQRLEWRRRTDDQLRAVVTGAVQLVAIRQRAAAAGVDPDRLLALVAPVPIKNVELSQVPGRTRDDETAALVMTVLLFMAIATYGAMVLSGVVEEKTSRVVEVLLARMPARTLLAGKVAGIGLLGLAQIGLTALVALVAVTTVDSVDLPAVRGAVLVWIVVWFVLGYALYATAFGALGSLASRAEDAQSVAGPVTAVLMAGYFVSFATIGSPDTAWARAVSFFPVTAPLAMPNRIAMGATTWWEPVLAAGVTLAAIAGLVQFGGRVYTGGILHSGPTLRLRDAWRGTTTAGGAAVHETRQRDTSATTTHRSTVGVLIGIGTVLGVVLGVVFHDVVIGVAVAAGSYATATRIVKARAGHNVRHLGHR
jgi:ABC-2 type transport system permease protein